jgi:hypothetical protein
LVAVADHPRLARDLGHDLAAKVQREECAERCCEVIVDGSLPLRVSVCL